MAILSIVTILIEGKEIEGFHHLKLTQNIHTQSVLEVHFPMGIFEGDEPIENHGSRSQNYLSKKISISNKTLYRNEELNEIKFSGIITEIDIIRGENTELGNNIVFIAKSNDIIANDGPNYKSFENKTLQDIVSNTLKDYGLKVNVSPSFKGSLEYVVQHNESAYEFVKRLAVQYGEWLYYDEDTLYFGAPGTKETELQFNYDLIDFKIKLSPKSQDYSFFTNNYLQDKVNTEKKQKVSFNNDKARTANSAASSIFLNTKNTWINSNNYPNTEAILKHKAKAQIEGIAVNQLLIEGVSFNPGVTVGNVIKIENASYRIIESIHAVSISGGYTNQFKGVPEEVKAYPLTNVYAYPKSESQIAIVKDNNDEEGLGRVRVAFAWQESSGDQTPWIRVLVPHAGKDQGFQFLPEIGDQVIVDFEGGNAECPYVVGSLYHSNQKPNGEWGGKKGNFTKALKTKGGHTIVFNDEGGSESITIKDKKGNTLLIDTDKENIEITALKNINITAGEDISIKAGGNVKITAGSNMESTAGQKLENKSGTDYKITAGTNAAISAGVGVDIKGTAKANLEAPMVDINGTGMTNVKGGIVNLN